MEELKPCPFCESHAVEACEDTDYPGCAWSVNCAICDGNVKAFESKDDAVGAWNRRAAVSLPAPDVIAFSHEGTMPYITQWTGYLASGENKLYTAQSIRALLEKHGISVID